LNLESAKLRAYSAFYESNFLHYNNFYNVSGTVYFNLLTSIDVINLFTVCTVAIMLVDTNFYGN